MKHYNNYFRHQTSLPPWQPPLWGSQCSQIQTINQRSIPSSAQGIKNRAPAQCVGFVLILTMPQDAFNLLRHLRVNPWVERGEEAPAAMPALREAGQHVSGIFTTHPALKGSLPKWARVKGEEQVMEKRMRNLKEPGSSLSRAAGLAHSHSTTTTQELCKTRYLLWDLFGVQVKVLHFWLMEKVTEKQWTDFIWECILMLHLTKMLQRWPNIVTKSTHF